MKRILILRGASFGLATVALLVGMLAVRPVFADTPKPQTNTAKYDAIISKCKADLASRLKVGADAIKVINKEPVTWPNSALGLPRIGEMSLQVMTPGLRLTLGRNDARYFYNISAKSFRYGGSPSLWEYSLLYINPKDNDPNLNGDLYQCSLLGTNSVRILSEVSDFYPQANGLIIAKRRTSRSFHDLVYVNPKDRSKSTVIATATDFGDAAVNDKGTKWAAYARPGMGQAWTIMVGNIGGDKKSTAKIDPPDDLKIKDIAWADDTLMILGERNDRIGCLSTVPSADNPEWKPAEVFDFPGATSFVLNKSQNLEVNQITVDNKPCVEVAVVWFTGEKNDVITIDDLKLKDCAIIGGRYTIIWGENEAGPVTYIVDYGTGEIISSLKGIGAGAKYLLHPVIDNPFAKMKVK